MSLFFILTNPFQYSIFDCLVSVCVFYLFTPFSSVLSVFHGKNLLLLNLINRYITSTSGQFLKNEDILEKVKTLSIGP